MHQPLAVLALAFAIASCITPSPGPQPPGPERPAPSVPPRPPAAPNPSWRTDDGGADLCLRAYEHMIELRCPPPEPKGGGTWVDVCHNANDNAISMHELCILSIQVDTTCMLIHLARAGGCER